MPCASMTGVGMAKASLPGGREGYYQFWHEKGGVGLFLQGIQGGNEGYT